jgi:ADP-Ribosyltransferase in polyvalent proteins/Large polyvalent protein associated domain 22
MARAPVISWDYYERERRRLEQKPAPKPADPVAETIVSIRQEQVRSAATQWPGPDEAARVNRLSRSTGLPPSLVEGREGDIERSQTADAMARFYRDYPLTAGVLMRNPRMEIAAQDDTKSMGFFASAWDTLTKIPTQLGSTANVAGLSAFDTMQTIDQTAQTLNYPVRAAVAKFGNMSGLYNYDPDREDAQDERRRLKRRAEYLKQIELSRPDYISPTQRGLLQGLDAVPLSLMALATRNPAAASSVMGGVVGSGAYMDARDSGVTGLAAVQYGVTQGGIEALTERIPAGALLDAVARKTPFGKALVKSLAAEIPGEQAATVLQDFTEWATLHPDKPFSAYVEARPDAAYQTLLGTVVGTSVQTGIVTSLNRAGRAADAVSGRMAAADDAQRVRAAVDQAGRAAEDSRLRARDPDAYVDLVRQHGEDSGVTEVYIPAEAVREYMQSDSYDQYADPFQDFTDQVEEAYAVGGDVVLPVEVALGKLPGTAAWGALKDQMRFSPGGMSALEADDFQSNMDDVLGELTDQMATQDRETKAALSTQEKLIESISAKLNDAGFTPYVSRQQAELIAQRISTRAARLGREVQGNEFDSTGVVQVLPPALAEARKADATDLVINAMRQGDAVSGQGPSLLQWISARGGIEDRGGDIASMGGDKWHREKPFRKKLLKAFEEAQGNMLGSSGANPNSLENLFDAAVSEGFFPELLARREAGEKLDSNDFLAAVGSELRGSPVFAREANSDRMREAGDELRQVLSERGLDPDSLTNAELRAAIERLQEPGSGEGYDQLPDTIDIDGAQRSTRNNLGMPLSGTEEGVRAFWKWFGDSKVVDEEGRPLVVYHGTTATFDQFKTDGRWKTEGAGAFFSSDPAVASTYVAPQSGDTDPQPQIYPVYLALDNMPDVDFEGKNWANGPRFYEVVPTGDSDGAWFENETDALEYAESLRSELADGDLAGDEDSVQVIDYGVKLNEDGFLEVEWDGPDSGTSTDGLAIDARIGGFDGIKLENVRDHGGRAVADDKSGTSDVYVAFRPEQIKSINNRGTFDTADARILYQSYGEGPHGRILFDQGRATIELFQSRNLSTMLHELSHMWLEELRADATMPDAPDDLKDDWQTVQDWFASNGHGLDANGNIPVEAHEMWARGGERYLMEGKAPSSALQRLFDTFRSWLVSIYKTVDALRSPITPEIREVFDRLIATDDQIAAMVDSQALAPLFKDAASIGMTGAEFDAYTAQVAGARGKAQSKLLEKTLASVRARVKKEYQAQRWSVEAEITAMVDDGPLYRALRNLKTTPISSQWIKDEMGIDALDLLPRRIPPVYRDGGAHPDAVAETSGYASGGEMIESLIGAELAHRQAKEGGDQRTMRNRAIQTGTDAEMDRRYGDPFTDGSIEQEALASVHGEKQGEVFAAEIRALSRKTGQRPTPYRVAREWARSKVRQGVYAVEASPSGIQRHQRSVAKAGRDAEKAILAGGFEEALRFKQQQMVSSALLAEAKEAHDEVESARKRLDRIARKATIKSVDQGYLDQAHSLLEAVDLRERSQKSITRQGQWEEWSAARTAEGYEIVVPPSFEATLGQTNWSRLTVENLLGLDEAVKQVIHLGRLKQTLLDNKERRDFEELVSEARAGAGGIKDKPPQDLMEPGYFDAIKSKVAGADAALLKMETVFDWLDGGNSNGVFNRIVFRPIADAQAREQDMLADYYGRIKALFEAVPGDAVARWDNAVSPPFTNRETGRPERLRRHQLISAALNVGNEGNLQRLTDGYGWNADALLEYLNTELTAAEWEFVQSVWDTIDTLWPEIEALEQRVNGVAPERVEARAVVTPHGTFRGGYYPAIYDSSRNYRAEENRGKEADLFEGRYTRATTRSSATKERSDRVTQPILLSLGVINRHIGEVVHDISHREAVIQANKFLSDTRIMRLVDDKLGLKVREQFRPWVKFVANSWAIERAGNEGFGKFIGQLRANTTAVGLGLRASTILVQVSGYANSIEVVGEKWIAEGIARFAANMIETSNFVLERSDEVRHRMDTIDRDIRTELSRLTASNPVSKAGHAVLNGRKFFFYGIGYMDRVVSVPTWLGAYNKALAEGMAEDEARYAGDKAVRASQGSAAPKDMAAIQRGTGKYGFALQLMTMFYTFLSAQYQRQRTLARDVMGADGRRPRNMPKLASRAFWLIVVPPLLTEVLKAAFGGGNPPDDDEWWTQWVSRKLLANQLGPIPMARDVFEPAWNAARGGQAFEPAISPINRALESFVNSARDVGKVARGEKTKKATKNALETAGYMTGLVPGQVASSTQFLVDVSAGDADPEGLSDWVEGLTTGKLKE